MSHRGGRDSLLDQCDRVGQQQGSFLSQGRHPSGGHWELEQILEQGRGAGDRQVVHVQQVGADHVQPRPVGHSTFHLSREHAGIDRVTQAPFLNPLMLNRFHPDRRHVDDLPCRGDGPGNATQ